LTAGLLLRRTATSKLPVCLNKIFACSAEEPEQVLYMLDPIASHAVADRQRCFEPRADHWVVWHRGYLARLFSQALRQRVRRVEIVSVGISVGNASRKSAKYWSK
jgi:hypothetical protein